MHVLAAQSIVPLHANAPTDGESDHTFRLPTRLAVRLAAESLLTGESGDALAAEAIRLFLAARQSAREKN